jgi:hypothetical protein
VADTEPRSNQFATGNGGTEFFLSSNAAEEAKDEVAGASNRLGVWALSNAVAPRGAGAFSELRGACAAERSAGGGASDDPLSR